jgi:hypothetical protein
MDDDRLREEGLSLTPAPDFSSTSRLSVNVEVDDIADEVAEDASAIMCCGETPGLAVISAAWKEGQGNVLG